MTDPDAWGVATGYHDYRGEWHETSQESLAKILGAMGADVAGPPPASAIVVRSDERPDLSEITTVRLEQGGEARP
ncbi:MAG: hypothetical protein ACRDKZ_11755, partial [Actinomycetota bacterium]